ncbi:VPLPA-CTERM sorting domain-containing protein [Parvularcula sp. LCG005]|uniref:VPLPA-CTERM sorting domain-containing protein n=1 Tax=Parvularcula sp. LCG005 TaxID=3078805 RepID=UPI002943927A|nr:VPLPA-CTERM sorting domain-containing protein [Parvularcula sp. LCG005]WOI53872.1 VPLPA-CTERM sorting domain-containing protein [Parvularcula sp. LCG005]
MRQNLLKSLPLRMVAATLTLFTTMGIASAATYSVKLQPITICEPAVPESCVLPTFDVDYLNAIFGVIGIFVDVQPSYQITAVTPTREAGTNNVRPVETLTDYTDFQDAMGFDPNTIYIGFTDSMIDTILGLAYVNDPDDTYPAPYGLVENLAALAILAGDAVTPAQQGQVTRFITAVLAHEMGHVLSAIHPEGDNSSLMAEYISATPFADPSFVAMFSPFSAEQILRSNLLEPVVVPLPAALPLFAAGFGGLLWGRRRATAAA